MFTHRGLSGPAILQVSSYWRSGEAVDDRLRARRRRPTGSPTPSAPIRASPSAGWSSRRCPRGWPRRSATGSALDGPIGGLSDRALAAAEQQLRGWRFTPNGSEGYAKAEVTIGGISTAELSSQTMEAKRVPGLFVIGEAVDVTGWLGGYNFQWAWASGVAAGEAL